MFETYYDRPTQVRFLDSEKAWHAGIAFKDTIICGCCGGIFEIDDILTDDPERIDPPIENLGAWADLEDALYGDIEH